MARKPPINVKVVGALDPRLVIEAPFFRLLVSLLKKEIDAQERHLNLYNRRHKISSALEKKQERSLMASKTADVCSGINRCHTILRMPAVMNKTKLSRVSLYRQVKAGTFPAPISLGERAVGWVESEIDAWIEKRMQARCANVPSPM